MQTLSGITVLDLSRMISGPYCTMLLADLGARVIKIEPPEGDENRQIGPPFPMGEGPFYLGANRSKESVVLDLSQEAGREVVQRLARGADVVIHNYRPKAAERLGVGYETIRALRPDVIYCAIDAFGDEGPYADRAGTDLIVQGMSGLMSITGEADGPPVRAGAPVADVTTALFATSGILAALLRRQAGGGGEYLKVPMLAVAIAVQAPVFAYAHGLGGPPPRGGSRSQISIAGDFATKDGRINVAIPTDKFWRRLCRLLGREELIEDERYRTNGRRLAHQDELYEKLDGIFRSRTTAEWEAVLGPQGVICGPVLDYTEVLSHPQVQSLGVFREVAWPDGGSMPLVTNPLRFMSATVRPPEAPPRLGQDTERVLREQGLSQEEIQRLSELGVTTPRPPKIE